MAIQTTYGEFPTSVALVGTLHGDDNNVRAGINKESTASMPFGFAVVYDGSTSFGVLNPDATTDKLRGFTVRSHAYSQEALGLGTAGAGTALKGVLPGNFTDVCEAGEMWVISETNAVAGDPVFVRAVATGGETEGAVRNAADSTDCIDCTGVAKYSTNATAAGLCRIKFDFTGAP